MGLVMQDRVDDPPVVRCPGCNQPMEAKERTPVKEGLVDIRYVCAGCGMETKRPIADEGH
jgi:DNA-directed RNA polymerase subunit RPC12/RpoP